MPAKPVSIEFVAEIAQYLRATKKVEVSTDDIADALVAVSKDADDLERDLNRAMKKAAKEPERLERVVKELGRSIEDTGDSAKKAGRRIEREFDQAGDEIADVGRDAGQEFVSNVGEAVSSGDLEGTVSGIAGGIVGGLAGPLGWAAAAVAATVVGAFSHFRQQSEELRAEIEQMVSDMTTGLIEGWRSVEGAIEESKLQDLVVETLSAMSGEEIAAAEKAAEELGIPWQVFAEFLAGDVEALAAVKEASEKAYAAGKEQVAGFSLLDNEISKNAVRVEDDLADAYDYVNDIITNKYAPAAEEAGEKTNAIVRYLNEIDGRSVSFTVRAVPGDTFTQTFIEQTGP